MSSWTCSKGSTEVPSSVPIAPRWVGVVCAMRTRYSSYPLQVSITFDPFMYITMNLPIEKKWIGIVYFVPLDKSKPTYSVRPPQ